MSKQIFISYRREGGEFLGKILYDELSKNGYSVFYDVESLRSGKFNEQLYKRIEECEYFIILLTPNCLDRCKNQNDWVRLEYEHAVKCGKNIIPILTRGFEFHEENLSETMKDLPMYERIEASADGMETAMKKLQRMIKSAPNTKLSETDEHSETKTFSKLVILGATHLVFMPLYFLVIPNLEFTLNDRFLFVPDEILWLTAFGCNILFGSVGLYLTNDLTRKTEKGLGLFYSVFCAIFAVFCLICGIF